MISYEDFTTSILNRDVAFFLSIIQGPCVSELLGYLLERKIPWFPPRPTKSESLGVELYASKFRWPSVCNEALNLKN